MSRTGKTLYKEIHAMVPVDEATAKLSQAFENALATLSPVERERFWNYHATEQIKLCTEQIKALTELKELLHKNAQLRKRRPREIVRLKARIAALKEAV